MSLSTDQGKSIGWLGRISGMLASLVWWSLLAILVLLALYAGIGRQISSNLDNFRTDIEQRLSRELGHEVSIGRLESRWVWLDPVVEAEFIDVVRQRDDEPLGSLRHLRIRLDTLASLFRFRLVFASFEADGLDVSLRHTPEGDLEVKGAELPEPTEDRLSHWLNLAGQWTSDPSVRITRVNLGLRDARGNIRHVDIPQLDLVYLRGMLYASGRAMRSGTNQQLASFRLLGQHFFRGAFNGQVYVDVNSGRYFDGLLEDFRWRGLRIEGMELGGQAWFTFDDGVLDQVTSVLETPYLQLGTDLATVAPIEAIRARVGWQRTAGAPSDGVLSQGRLHVKDLQWNWDDYRVEPFNLSLTSGPSGLQFAGDGLALEALAVMTRRLGFLPVKVLDALRNYAPTGYLDHWQLALPGPEERLFRLAGELRDLQVNAHGGAPGIANLDGTIVLDEKQGVVVADGTNVTLGFPKLFADSWLLDRLQGTVAWSLEPDVTRVYADDLHMQYQENTLLKGAFDLRLSKTSEDNLGLRVGVENGTADMLGRFIPYHAVDPGLYDWLTNAIRRADIERGEYFGHGQIGEGAPPGSFNSAMWYRFANADIRYHDSWPEVSAASGIVHIHDGHTRVQLATGATGGLTLNPSEVRVEPGEAGPTVHVRAAATVPGQAIPYWISDSPLGEMAGEATGNLEVDGDTGLELTLALPLGEDSVPLVRADIHPQNVHVKYPGAELDWQGVQGMMTYSTEDGFSGDPLSASFLGQPVQVHFDTGPSDNSLVIRQTGQLEISSLLAKVGLDGKASGIDGGFGYQVRLEVEKGREPELNVSSNLEGVAIELPEPLGKAAGEETPLWASLASGQDDELVLAGYWGDRLAFNLAWRDESFHRGRVALQVPETPLPQAPGLIVSGPLERFDLEAWQEAFSGLAGDRRGDSQESFPAESLINHLDLQVRELVFLGQSFSYVQVDAAPQTDGAWLVDTRSPRASGRITIPGETEQPIAVEFSELKLARADGQAEPGQALTLEQQLDAFRTLAMEDWPDVDIRIDDLRMNDDHLGRWSLELRPEPGRLRMPNIEGRLDDLALRGELIWGDAGNREVSRFSGTIEGGGLQALNPLTESGIPFRNDQTAIKLDLDWPGRPDDFTLAELSGNVSLRLDDGVILEQNNTAQLFRVFNLLNTDTLWRRLQFDFSDLYEAGVAFDAISGTAIITEGLVTWDPELQVVGPSGAFKLSGTTNMDEESLNMKLVVVLPLTQNLPLAALLLGASAPIGGALFVLDKILGDPLSKLTSATYSVTGTWSEPKVDLQGVFGAGD